MSTYHARKYERPKQPDMERRVYILPSQMADAIREYGFANGCPSEVEAVRQLLNTALKAWEAKRP
jgi:hypothetical protein